MGKSNCLCVIATTECCLSAIVTHMKYNVLHNTQYVLRNMECLYNYIYIANMWTNCTPCITKYKLRNLCTA